MKHLIHHVEYSNFILHRGVPMSILTQVSNVMQEILQNWVCKVFGMCVVRIADYADCADERGKDFFFQCVGRILCLP